MGTRDLCRVPLASAHHGRAWQSSGTGPCYYCRKVLLVPGPAGQCSRFYREARGTRRSRHVVKRSSDLRVAHPEIKVQVRDLVRVVSIVAPLPRGCSVSGENWFYRAPEGRWAQETCAGCPQ